MPAVQHDLVRHFRDRLIAASRLNPLLRISQARTARLLDCARLAAVEPELPGRVLEAVVSGGRVARFNLRLEAVAAPTVTAREDAGQMVMVVEEAPAEDQPDHAVLYRVLDERIRRHA